MKLTGEQKRILREGVTEAYPRQDELTILLSEEMDEQFDAHRFADLEEIAKGDDYKTVDRFKSKGIMAM